MELAPKRMVRRDGPERQVDDDRGEGVSPFAEIGARALGVLKVLVASLGPDVSPQARHVHVVVVDQEDPRALNDYVAVLKVAVGDVRRAKVGHHLAPHLGHLGKDDGPAEVLLDEQVEELADRPLHLDDRKVGPANANALLEIGELHEVGELALLKVPGDGRVTPLLPLASAREALHRVSRLSRDDLEDHREVAGATLGRPSGV